MPTLGSTELIIVLVLVIIVFGVGKLPPASHGAFIVQHSWDVSPAGRV